MIKELNMQLIIDTNSRLIQSLIVQKEFKMFKNCITSGTST